VLLSTDADVIVLQEAISDGAPYIDPPFEAACGRVAQLQAALVAAGFVHTAQSKTATCTMILSKLPFAHPPESIDLDEAHQWGEKIKTCVGKLARDAEGRLVGAAATLNQRRAAVFAKVQLGSGQFVGVYGAHFHHLNYSSSSDGCRKAEVEAVLRHYHCHCGSRAVSGGGGEGGARTEGSEEGTGAGGGQKEMSSALITNCSTEIVDLHRFFVDWFAGNLADSARCAFSTESCTRGCHWFPRMFT
jgi:hypothetical protein